MKSNLNPVCQNCQNNSGVIKKYDPGFSSNKSDNFSIYYCTNCQNGFTYPVPKNIGDYYPDNYWLFPGLLGFIKLNLFRIFQRRRADWVKRYLKKGHVLDVGSGEGSFSRGLDNFFLVTNLEPVSSKVRNPAVIKKDFLNWRTTQRFDAITFWESLEHTSTPQRYLEKASKLLSKGGFVFIEYPRVDSLEAKIFGNSWFHLDPPRHLVHLTEKGLTIISKREGFKKIAVEGVLAPEYSVWGFIASFLDKFNQKSTDRLKNGGMAFIISLTPLIALSILTQLLFITFNQSPISLMILKKRN